MYLRHRFLDVYDKTIRAEATLKDLNQVRLISNLLTPHFRERSHIHYIGACLLLFQLKQMQTKMAAALSIYYKYRSLYGEQELKRIQNEANVNGTKVGTIQADMNKALDKIADFLQNQLDGDTIRTLAMERVLRMEKGEEVEDIASVVTPSRPVTRDSGFDWAVS